MTKKSKVEQFNTGRETIQVKTPFSHTEKVSLSEALAKANTDATALEEQKKNVVAEFGNKIKVLKAQVNELSSKIHAGYEYRPQEAIVQFHTPEKNKKTYVSLRDKHTIIGGPVPMTPADLIVELPIPGLPPASKAPARGVRGAKKGTGGATARSAKGAPLPNPVLPGLAPGSSMGAGNYDSAIDRSEA